MSRELQGVYWRSILPTKLVATTTPLKNRKNNFGLFIYSSTNPAKFMKIGPVDVDIIGLTEITKIYKKIKDQQNISPPRLCLAQSGWAKKKCKRISIIQIHVTAIFQINLGLGMHLSFLPLVV